jgi:signal transduction histidine kinase
MDEQTAHTPPKEQQPSLDLRTSTILLTLQRVLLEALDFEEVVRRIVNQLLMEPYFHERGYRIIVLNLVDEERALLQPSITLGAEQQGDQLVISVADTGAGITQEALPHVFEGFAKVDPRHTT